MLQVFPSTVGPYCQNSLSMLLTIVELNGQQNIDLFSQEFYSMYSSVVWLYIRYLAVVKFSGETCRITLVDF